MDFRPPLAVVCRSAMFGLLVFLFLPKPADAATVSTISPTNVVTNVSEVTITGSGFGAYDSQGDQVCFNALSEGYSVPSFCTTFGGVDMLSWSDTTIVFKAPYDPSGLMIGGRIHVNVDGTLFDGPYYNVQPVISSVDYETTAAGGAVTITGKYLKYPLGGTGNYFVHVYFNGLEGTVTDTWTDTSVQALVPTGATTGPISVSFNLEDGTASVSATGPTITILTGATNDTYSALQQYIKTLNIDDAWPLVGASRAPIVAIIDDGVYINHPDLRYNIWINSKEAIGNGKDDDKNGYVDDIYGWNFVTRNGEMTTRGTHGTLVAGIIGAAKNNQEGVTGINSKVKLMPLIVCDAQLGCPTSNVVKAIFYAVDKGATVINLSLGTNATTGYSTAFNRAIKYAYDHGVVVVAAAGNGDVESSTGQDLNVIPQSPVCNDVGKNAVIGVGAVDADNERTTWSNFGTRCVDAYATGVDIVSTAVAIYNELIPGSNYGYGSGTSFAAPIVTGAVALLRQQYPSMHNDEILRRVRLAVNASGVLDVYKLLYDARNYKPALVTAITPASIQTSKLTGLRTITVTGKRFSKTTKISVGGVKATVQYISPTQLKATFDIKTLSYGTHLVTAIGSNRQTSLFRWFTIKK